MEKEDLYPIIFKRKSIRKYDLTPLDKDTLKEIKKYIHELIPLNEDIKTEIKIIGSDDVNRRMMKKAPHYFAVFSEIKEGYLTNVGFKMQQMDLILSANGIGTCWQGIPMPKKEVLDSDLNFIILMAFGMPSESLYRESTSEFKRKSIKNITNIQGSHKILEAARLAPSATNSQPWFFMGDDTVIHAYSVKPNFLKAIVVNKYIPIDIGIAIYHLKVAAEYFGNKPKITYDKTIENNTPKGYQYFASIKMEN